MDEEDITPHGDIEVVIAPHVFEVQASRTWQSPPKKMQIIRNRQGELLLLNCIKLVKRTLKELNKLGEGEQALEG
jgi:hypothetical protein